MRQLSRFVPNSIDFGFRRREGGVKPRRGHGPLATRKGPTFDCGSRLAISRRMARKLSESLACAPVAGEPKFHWLAGRDQVSRSRSRSRRRDPVAARSQTAEYSKKDCFGGIPALLRGAAPHHGAPLNRTSGRRRRRASLCARYPLVADRERRHTCSHFESRREGGGGRVSRRPRPFLYAALGLFTNPALEHAAKTGVRT